MPVVLKRTNVPKWGYLPLLNIHAHLLHSLLYFGRFYYFISFGAIIFISCVVLNIFSYYQIVHFSYSLLGNGNAINGT